MIPAKLKPRLSLKVKAGARRTEFSSKAGEVWVLRVAAPPVDGKANKQIVRFVADLAGVPQRQVRIVMGETNSLKIVEVEGISAAELERRIVLSLNFPTEEEN